MAKRRDWNMKVTHPLENAIARMSPRDQRIADRLAEAGFSDEGLYAALPNPGADRLLQGKAQPKKVCKSDPTKECVFGPCHAEVERTPGVEERHGR